MPISVFILLHLSSRWSQWSKSSKGSYRIHVNATTKVYESTSVGMLWFGPSSHVFVESVLCLQYSTRQFFLSFCVGFDHFYIISTRSWWETIFPWCIENALCLIQHHHPYPSPRNDHGTVLRTFLTSIDDIPKQELIPTPIHDHLPVTLGQYVCLHGTSYV